MNRLQKEINKAFLGGAATGNRYQQLRELGDSYYRRGYSNVDLGEYPEALRVALRHPRKYRAAWKQYVMRGILCWCPRYLVEQSWKKNGLYFDLGIRGRVEGYKRFVLGQYHLTRNTQWRLEHPRDAKEFDIAGVWYRRAGLAQATRVDTFIFLWNALNTSVIQEGVKQRKTRRAYQKVQKARALRRTSLTLGVL